MTIRLVAGSVAVVVLVSGCGSSRLSHDAFGKRANEICTAYDSAVKKLRTPRTLTQVERYANRVLPIYRRALAALAQLRPPQSDAPAVRSWLRADRAIERDLVRLSAAADSRQIPRVQAVVVRARADNSRSNRLARRLGLTVCAKS